MSNKVEWEKLRKARDIKNIEEIFKTYSNKEEQIKIKSYCKKYNLKIQEVNERISLRDRIIASIFAKEATKQNIYEKIACEYINKIQGVHNFIKLPARQAVKNGALYIENNIISSLKKDGKSIDFQWEYNNHKCFAFHKYIRENGGAQDNQFNDVLNSIKIASGSVNTGHFLIFICDGKYFTKERMDNLKNRITNRTHVVLHIEDLEEFLKTIK